MARVAIVTDSTSDLSPDLQRRHHVTVVPLNVHFGDDVLRDQLDITTDEFMQRLQRSSTMPTTSQPSAGLFEETFRRLAADHDEIVAVLISSKLSGTIQSAMIAAEAVKDEIPVTIVDSFSATLGLGLQAIRASTLVEDGLSGEEIAVHVRGETAAYQVVFFVDTLEYLQRGGRIGRAAALLGGILQLKPLIRLDEGQIVPYERTRTRSKATQGLVDFAKGLPHVERIASLFSTDRSEGEMLANRLAEARGIPRDQVEVAQMGPVVGVHVGPGALGVAVFEGAEA